MAYEDFDYGTNEEIKDPGNGFKKPAVGDHSARLRSLIHVGMYREEFKGEMKKPFPEVIAVWELKEDDDFEEDGVTPLTITKSFPLKKGDKAFLTKFLAAMDPQKKAKGFDDLIGGACTIACKGSKDLNEDGTPKYVNFGGISGLPAKFAAMLEPLVVKGAGHVRFEDITKEAILELNPIKDVEMVLMKAENYSGSVAEEVIKAIRVDNPDFAVRKASDKDKGEGTASGSKPQEKAEEKPTDLKEDEEF